MDFPQKVYDALKRYSEAEETINVSVINQFGQEFTISGFIPKFHITRDKGYPCEGVRPHYFILNFGKHDETATIKLFCPADKTDFSVHPLTIKEIKDNYNSTIFENENYDWAVWKVNRSISEKHGTAEFWQPQDELEKRVYKKLLGKAPTYMGYKYPELRGSNCLITGIIPGLSPETLALYLKHEKFKTFGLERLVIEDIKNIFDLRSIDMESTEDLMS